MRELLGHAPKHVTELYEHPSPERRREAILAMAEQTDAGLHQALEREAADEKPATAREE